MSMHLFWLMKVWSSFFEDKLDRASPVVFKESLFFISGEVKCIICWRLMRHHASLSLRKNFTPLMTMFYGLIRILYIWTCLCFF